MANKILYKTVLDKAPIAEGHCHNLVQSDLANPKRYPCCERHVLYKSHPEVCTTELRQCPGCKQWLCQSCWDEHDISHFGRLLLFDHCWVCSWNFGGDLELCDPEPEEAKKELGLKDLPKNFKYDENWTKCPMCGASRSSSPSPPMFHG